MSEDRLYHAMRWRVYVCGAQASAVRIGVPRSDAHPLRTLGRDHGDGAGRLSVGSVAVASGTSLLWPRDTILPHHVTMPGLEPRQRAAPSSTLTKTRCPSPSGVSHVGEAIFDQLPAGRTPGGKIGGARGASRPYGGRRRLHPPALSADAAR